MPRIAPWLLRRARNHSANTAALLYACKDLESAVSELRWIREYVESSLQSKPNQRAMIEQFVAKLCRQRGKGVPLQYILGSQPFGTLDIKCRSGVLIPRPETEAYTCHLAHLIKTGKLLGPLLRHSKDGLNIVDFCTGTGCIPILLFSSLQGHAEKLNVLGVDISSCAVELAEENIAHNVKSGCMAPPLSGQNIEIARWDIFSDNQLEGLSAHRWDVMVSNPPYISQRVWNYGLGHLGYSVRKYEPSLALVPGAQLRAAPGWNHEDVFYSRLLEIAARHKPKAVLLEIGDEEQARRVIAGFSRHRLSSDSHVEIWRDCPDLTPTHAEEKVMRVARDDDTIREVPVKGSGQIRSILIKSR